MSKYEVSIHIDSCYVVDVEAENEEEAEEKARTALNSDDVFWQNIGFDYDTEINHVQPIIEEEI